MTIANDELERWKDYATGDRIDPVHPGEILSEDFLKAMGISQSKLAADLRISFRRVNELCLGKRAFTAETSLLLAKYFGTSPGYWLRLQTEYDLRIAMAKLPFESLPVRPCVIPKAVSA